MSTEENVHSDDTADEEFKYVKQGRAGDLRTTDRAGLGTVVTLLTGLIVCVVFDRLAQRLSTSHEVRSTDVPMAIVAVMPYIGAAFILVTCLAAVVFLFIVIACIGPLIDSQLNAFGVKLIFSAPLIVLGLSAATVMYLWWFYTT